MRRLPQGEVGEGEGASPPLKLDLSLSQRENQVKPPKIDRPPSSSSTEITASGRGETQREYQVKRLRLNLDHPSSCDNSTEIPHARRECQAREGEGTRHLLNFHHHPGGSSSQEIPVHHPGGQLA